MEKNEREILLSMLSEFDEKELRAFTDKVAHAYSEMIEHCRPLLTRGNDVGAVVGIIIALRQLADNITEQCGNMNMPLVNVLADLFNDGLKL